MVQFRLLGPVEARTDVGAVPIRRQQERCVLAVLLLAGGTPVPAERLADLIWPDGPPDTARQVVQTYVSRLRRVLADADAGPEPAVTIGSRAGCYFIEVDAEAVDSRLFETLVGQARDVTDPDGRARLLRRALALWRGPALGGIGPAEVQDRLGRRLEQLRRDALELRIAADLELGRASILVTELMDLLAERPDDEPVAGYLMEALRRCGRRTEALAVFRSVTDHLRDELGLDPGRPLQDLHRAILNDSPVGAVGDAVPDLLPAPAGRLVGRGPQLDALTALVDPSAAPIAVVAGPGGIGKTTLAVHWAQQVKDRFPGGRLYVNLRGFDPSDRPVPAAEALRSFLDALGVKPEAVPDDPAAQLRKLRSLISGERVLIVLDNARDADQVRPLLTASTGSYTLITSRNNLIGLVAASGARYLTVPAMTGDEAREMVLPEAGRSAPGTDDTALRTIVDRCAGLPLALAIVAARIAVTDDASVATLADELSSRGPLDALDIGDALADVRGVLSWSYRRLGPSDARVLRLLGLHPVDEFDAPAAASLCGVPVAVARRSLDDLAADHLVHRTGDDRYALHDLVKAFAVEQSSVLDGADERRAANHRLLNYLAHTTQAACRVAYPYRAPLDLEPTVASVEPGTFTEPAAALAWLVRCADLVRAAVERAAADNVAGYPWQLAYLIGAFSDQRGMWSETFHMFELTLAHSVRTGDRPGQGISNLGRGLILLRWGRDDEAVEAFTAALSAGDSLVEGHALSNLARLADRDGRQHDALELTQRAAGRYKAAGQPLLHARALSAIGWYHIPLGNHAEAQRACEEALELMEDAGDRNGAAATLDTLGYIHHHRQRFAEAAGLFRRAAHLHRANGDTFDEALVLSHLGDTYLAADRRTEAAESWRQALELFRLLDDQANMADVRAKLETANPPR